MRAATFTTYINAQTDPGLEQAFSRQTKLAESSYATITRAAEAATRATAGLLGARGTAGAAAGNQQIQQRATAIRSTVTASAEAERASVRLATATAREARAAASAAQDHRKLAGSLQTTATALNVVSGRLDPVSSRVSTLARAVTDLTGVQLGLAAFGATLFAIGRTANTYANLEARVRPFFETQKQVNAAMNDIVGIAQRSRSALEPVVDVYTRLTTVGQNIGLTRNAISQVTEIATKASSVGGGTAQARDAALLQFGQALSGDFKAAGQEINSLKEQAPVLFQAILKGYKDVDGTIGVSLARFKKLSEAGELSTAKVLDAVRRSSSYIDEMAARVPNTLSRAGTDFGNSLTITVGRLDQAVGFTSTLAGFLSVAAQNMRVLVALAGGAATAFAAVKLTGLVTDGAAAIRTTLVMRAAVDALAERRKITAAASLAQHTREVAALEAEQIQVREQIALETQRQALARRDISRAVAFSAPGQVGPSAGQLAAERELRNSLRESSQLRQRATVLTEASVAANARAAASTTALARATTNVASRVGVFRSAAGSLISFLGGPWVIAIGLAATAVYLLATAQTAAEAATNKFEASQRTFANTVDRSTGKVYDQIGALQKLSLQKNLGESVSTSFQQFRSTGGQIVNGVAPLLGAGARPEYRTINGFRTLVQGQDRRTPQQLALAQAVGAFQRGERGSAPRLQQLLADPGIQRGVPGLAQRAAGLGDLFGTLNQRAGEVGQGAAARRVIAGTARDGDVARAFGEDQKTTTGGVKPRTKAQIDAAARAEAAQNDVQAARAQLAKIKADGKNAGESDEAYQTRLAAAYKSVTAAVEGQKQARAGAAAGRAADRKAARDAVQDAKDEAAARRDAATERLLATHPDTGSTAFLEARQKILKTYDDEINKIDSSAAASRTASSQRIADLKKEEDAAAGRGEKRRDILANYDDAPKAVDRARDQINALQQNVDHLVDGVAAITDANPLGRGLYTQEMADADARRIEQGVRKPLLDLQRDFDRGVEIASLQLQGRDAEAAALEKRNGLLDQGIDLTRSEYEGLVANERQQLRINDALASRQRVVSAITGALDSARDTAETFLTNVGNNPAGAFKTALKDFQAQFTRINARTLVEKLFAGSDEKLRALVEGKSSVDTAIGSFGSSVDMLTSTSSRGESAVARLATAAENAAARLDSVAGGGGGLAAGRDAIGDESAEEVVVTGRRLLGGGASGPTPRFGTPSGKAVLNTIGGSLFGKATSALDSLVDKVGLGGAPKATSGGDLDGLPTVRVTGSQFFKKIGDSFGTALQGAGQGAIASGFVKALGIKQSQTGSQIGGAIGGLTGLPGGALIGGILGGTIGGLFKKTKQASSTLTFEGGELTAGAAVGTGGTAKKTADGLGGGVVAGLQSIAESLGATLTGAGSVSIGYRPGHKAGAYRVDTTGSGRLTGVQAFDTEAEAIQFAIQDALKDGVIAGISEASKRILASGQDLTKALNKATAIESIPKRLLQLTDPVKFAVSNLNDEFLKLIGYLKEGGATAEQFADAQKLYDLERAKAVEAASASAADQITQFLKDLVGTTSSPLNKATVYENAAAEFGTFSKDIAAGKAVDQSNLLNAARNFQDASRALNGSSSSFFDDFDMLRSVLEKARDNAGVTGVTTLPASPFSSDATVQQAIATLQGGTVKATQDQTAAIVDALAGVQASVDRIVAGGASGGGEVYRSSVALLPGFAAA